MNLPNINTTSKEVIGATKELDRLAIASTSPAAFLPLLENHLEILALKPSPRCPRDSANNCPNMDRLLKKVFRFFSLPGR
jgi:hypothetical protein